jgi:hypothetical protein
MQHSGRSQNCINGFIKYRIGIVLFGFLTSAGNLNGQSGTSDPPVYPGGITLQYGLSSYAVKDHYISQERYDGMFPHYAIAWTRTHNRYAYNLGFAYRQAGDITNYNISTRIVSFNLSQGFLYPLKPVSLFKRDLNLWLGPTAEVFYYENNPDIAVSGFDYTNSYATLVSLGFRGDGIYPFSDKFRIKSWLKFTLLSLGMRTVDLEEDKEPGTKLLTPFSGLNGSFDLGMCYDLSGWLSVGLSYRFELTRISAWENVLSASNGGIFALYFRF